MVHSVSPIGYDSLFVTHSLWVINKWIKRSFLKGMTAELNLNAWKNSIATSSLLNITIISTMINHWGSLELPSKLIVRKFSKISFFYRKFNNSVATCHADATVKTISWLKDGKELVSQCEDCSELDLFIQLFPDDYAFYECHVNETTGNAWNVEETKLVDKERFPGHENYTISWFECCGGVSFIYLHLDLVNSPHFTLISPWFHR